MKSRITIVGVDISNDPAVLVDSHGITQTNYWLNDISYMLFAASVFSLSLFLRNMQGMVTRSR